VIAIWLIYYVFNLYSSTDPPLWAAAAVLIGVDKMTDFARERFAPRSSS